MQIRFLSLWLFLAVSLLSVQAQTLELSSLGFSNDNTSIFLQALNDPAVDTIIVDLQSQDWLVGPMVTFGVTDKTVIFEEGVVVRAISGAFDDPEARLFNFREANGITLIGYGATIAMIKAEYVALNDSEFRHAVSFFNCENVRVEGLTLRDSGGDGIYIGGENNGGGLGKCRNVTVTGVQCINNYRQGMSIASVENMLVTNSIFRDTQGTLPEAGIDIEPYLTYQEITGLRIENCSFINNGWAGIAVALEFMDASSPPVDIEVVDCYLSDNRRPGNPYAFTEIFLGADENSPVDGQVNFERVAIDGSDWTAVYSHNPANAYRTDFIDCFFKDVSREDVAFNEPIFFETPSYDQQNASLGNVHFDNVVLTYSLPFAALRVFTAGTVDALEDMSGQITVIAPDDYGVDLDGLPTNNYSLNVDYQSDYPETSVSSTLNPSHIDECTGPSLELTIDRMSNDLSLPLMVTWDTEGTATINQDYTYIPPASIVPTGGSTTYKELVARKDGIAEPTETITLNFTATDCYALSGPTTLETEIIDCSDSPLAASEGFALDVRLDGRDAQLNWSAPSLGEISSYTVEHTHIAGYFSPIAELSADATNLSYLHKNLAQGLHYYRIQYNMVDGNTLYSNIEQVNRELEVELYPNPVLNELYIDAEIAPGFLQIYNAGGQLLKEVEKPAFPISTSELSSGTYWVQALDSSGEPLFIRSFQKR